MPNKKFVQISILVLVLTSFLAVPHYAQAGGVCGGTFIVEKGQTLESIAAMCGTTVSAITAANPGLSGSLTTGQVITVPGSNYSAANTPAPGATPTSGATTVTNNYYITNNYYNSVPSNGTTGTSTYVVQPGDTFSLIAVRFGVSVNTLWAANPGIKDINLLYIGQVINIPGSTSGSSGGITIQTVPTQELIPRSWGTAPKGTGKADVKLVNKSQSEVYVSLQGQMKDDTEVINEYPVKGTMNVRVPQGWYTYVAWVGGKKMVGQFNLGESKTLTFYKDKVVVD
jgi:peptidoglycan endopeptidase LytE